MFSERRSWVEPSLRSSMNRLRPATSTVADEPVFSRVSIAIERTIHGFRRSGQERVKRALLARGGRALIEPSTMASAVAAEIATSRASIIRLMRPHQWIKNLLVLAALVFAKRLFVFHDLILALTAFLAFCALS